MDIEIKTFNELDTDTLYDILQLRSSVFVVEQNCVYQDIDGKDKEALHIILKKNGLLLLIRAVLLLVCILKKLLLEGFWLNIKKEKTTTAIK